VSGFCRGSNHRLCLRFGRLGPRTCRLAGELRRLDSRRPIQCHAFEARRRPVRAGNHEVDQKVTNAPASRSTRWSPPARTLHLRGKPPVRCRGGLGPGTMPEAVQAKGGPREGWGARRWTAKAAEQARELAYRLYPHLSGAGWPASTSLWPVHVFAGPDRMAGDAQRERGAGWPSSLAGW